MEKEVKKIEFNRTELAENLPGSVADTARRLGISRQHLNNILKGHREPSRKLTFQISRILEIPLQALVKEG